VRMRRFGFYGLFMVNTMLSATEEVEREIRTFATVISLKEVATHEVLDNALCGSFLGDIATHILLGKLFMWHIIVRQLC
jgi:hypothetical protein